MIKLCKLSMVVVLLIFNSACADGLGLWTVKVKVIDDAGLPIVDAKVVMNFLLPEGSNNYMGFSNDKGIVQKTRPGVLRVIFLVTKDEHYDARFEGIRGSQEVMVVLREKKNPIPMYAKKTHLHADKKNIKGNWVGYDFMVGDYMPPYGRGVYKDFEFNYTYDRVDFFNNRYNLVVRFTNKGDGLIEFKVNDYTSKFKSYYLAPEVGYKNEFKYYEYRSSSDPMLSNVDRSRKYYFRVRTQFDENGSVVSALYGKLYSEFPDLHYYLNPNDNDRNIEFDPKQNLFLNLTKKERQFEP